MKKGNDNPAPLFAVGLPLVIWLGLIAAPLLRPGGLAGIISGFAEVNPFYITITEGSIKTTAALTIIYIFGAFIYMSSRKHYRRGEEHGSAKWGSSKIINSRYADKRYSENKLLTRNVRIGFDGKRHRRNLNVMVVGGSGSGKTRYYAKPNVMQANTSLVVLDPKGEIMQNRDHIALKYYRAYHTGSAKTLKSIQITLAARLEKFNLPELAKLTMIDEMDFAEIGQKKTALFAIIPDNDSSFNFLISILYTQLFQALFLTADRDFGGTLPVHVHFLMDEFAKVAQFYR